MPPPPPRSLAGGSLFSANLASTAAPGTPSPMGTPVVGIGNLPFLPPYLTPGQQGIEDMEDNQFNNFCFETQREDVESTTGVFNNFLSVSSQLATTLDWQCRKKNKHLEETRVRRQHQSPSPSPMKKRAAISYKKGHNIAAASTVKGSRYDGSAIGPRGFTFGGSTAKKSSAPSSSSGYSTPSSSSSISSGGYGNFAFSGSSKTFNPSKTFKNVVAAVIGSSKTFNLTKTFKNVVAAATGLQSPLKSFNGFGNTFLSNKVNENEMDQVKQRKV